jgi:hypothetical protein
MNCFTVAATHLHRCPGNMRLSCSMHTHAHFAPSLLPCIYSHANLHACSLGPETSKLNTTARVMNCSSTINDSRHVPPSLVTACAAVTYTPCATDQCRPGRHRPVQARAPQTSVGPGATDQCRPGRHSHPSRTLRLHLLPADPHAVETVRHPLGQGHRGQGRGGHGGGVVHVQLGHLLLAAGRRQGVMCVSQVRKWGGGAAIAM